MVLLLAIASAVSLGVADYVLGETLRRDGRTESALAYTAIGSLVGIFVVGVSWPIAPPESFTAADALWGLAAGSAIGLALPLLMIGIARGPIAVVAPVIGLVSLVVPAIVGPLLGDQLTALEIAGLLVALPASAMVAAHPAGFEGGLPIGRALTLAATAGALLGTAAIFFGRTSTESGVGPAVVSQIGATVLLLAIALASRRLVRPTRESAVLAVVAGALTALAALTSVLAYQRGPVAVVAAVIGLAPGPTVLLAWLIAHEEINRIQLSGFGLGVCAVVLFAVG